MGKEKLFENKVKRFLESEGCYFVKYWGGYFTKAGVPDLLICVNGYFLAVELKADNGKPSQLQLLNIKQIRKAGGKALILYPDDFEMFKNLVKDLKK